MIRTHGKRVIQGRVLWKACHPGAGSMESVSSRGGFYGKGESSGGLNGKRVIQGRILWKGCHSGAVRHLINRILRSLSF